MATEHLDIRAPALAKAGFVPEHLVGVPYRTMTKQQNWDVRVYRCGRNLCIICGYHGHGAVQCPKREALHAKHKEYGQCLHCGSPVHEIEECPHPKAVAQAVGRRARAGEAPNDLEGIAFSTFSEVERVWHHHWMVEHGMCLTCKEAHPWYTCKVRLEKVAKRYYAKVEAIRSGKLDLKTELTGPLARLPAELRLRIFEEAFKNRTPITVRPGWINAKVRTRGLPLRETLEGFVKSNTFYLPDRKASERFKSTMEKYSLVKFVRAVQIRTDVNPSVRTLQGRSLANDFPKLSKIAFLVGTDLICAGPGRQFEVAVPAYVRRLGFQSLASYKQIKGLLFRVHYSVGHQSTVGESLTGLRAELDFLVATVREEMVKIGRADVHVAAVTNGVDREWDAI